MTNKKIDYCLTADYEELTINTGGGCWVDYFSFKLLNDKNETRFFGVGFSEEVATWHTELQPTCGVPFSCEVADWLVDKPLEKEGFFDFNNFDEFELKSTAGHLAVSDVYIRRETQVIVFRLKNNICVEIKLNDTQNNFSPSARLISWDSFCHFGKTLSNGNDRMGFVGSYDNVSDLPTICQPDVYDSHSLTHVFENFRRCEWKDWSPDFILIEERRPDERNRQNPYDEPFSIHDRDDMGFFRTLEDAEEAVLNALAEGLE